jgi:hypothetical protein
MFADVIHQSPHAVWCCAWLQALLWDVVLPGDYLVLAWDLVMLLVILYLCIVLPYTVAFAIDFVSGACVQRRVLTGSRHPIGSSHMLACLLLAAFLI